MYENLVAACHEVSHLTTFDLLQHLAPVTLRDPFMSGQLVCVATQVDRSFVMCDVFDKTAYLGERQFSLAEAANSLFGCQYALPEIKENLLAGVAPYPLWRVAGNTVIFRSAAADWQCGLAFDARTVNRVKEIYWL